MEPFAALLCSVAGLRPLRQSLSRWLQQDGIGAERRNAILLATHEAAANAIQHSLPDGPVTISGHRQPHTITMVVAKETGWADGDADNEERGRGLTIISALVDELTIHTNSQHTTLSMQTHVNHPVGASAYSLRARRSRSAATSSRAA